ncbi:MAG: pitrilysin family protein, partial [Planctomycetia bacterium]|nr:pitrilysin family protein [Planctomycetia bacterium]
MTTIHTQTFSNGFTLLAEPMDWLESVAYQLAIPAGTSLEPVDRAGLAGFTCEMVLRGAGDRSSRQVIDDFDRFGIHRDETVGAAFTQYSGSTLAEYLDEALSLIADLARRAHLPAEELEWSRTSGLQELRAIEDEPSDRVAVELRRRAFSIPWNRIPQGSVAGCTAIRLEDVRRFYERYYRPNGAILAVAGRFQWESLLEQVVGRFGDWKPLPEPQIGTIPQKWEGVRMTLQSAAQTQIGCAWRSVPANHPDYLLAWGLTNVLSGSMSSRLSTTMRERNGLCYSVCAAQTGTLREGFVFSQLGTSPDQERTALSLFRKVLDQLGTDTESSTGSAEVIGGPVREDEVTRLKIRAKASLLMQRESSAAHAASLVSDWYHFGRVRTSEEILELVESLTADRLNEYVPRYVPTE